ncbi:MAG TPA: alpha/beta hydrolase [Gammaproteobacteria bacterium]|nr:alpha/beta hydrolase [Gammaproteobacteria bacterium]
MRPTTLPSVLLASLAALAAGGVLAQSAVHKIPDIEYARSGTDVLRLDLYESERTTNETLLVWLHGGAWENGSKAAVPAGVIGLVGRGYAIASVDFLPASAARFPAQVLEIKAAIRFLRAQARTYGYDATRIGILGVSSGAHLAALVGTSNGEAELEGSLGEHLDQSSAVQAIVSYFGASNLMTILDQSTPFGVGVRQPALIRLLGGLPSEVEPIAKLASPVFHVDSTDPPLLLLHGDQDRQMPINQSHELEGAYERQGLNVDFIVVHDAGHGGDAFYAPAHLQRVVSFLDAELRPKRRRPGT